MIDTLGCSFAALLFLFLVLSSATRLNEDGKQESRQDAIFGAQKGTVSPLLIRMSNNLASRLQIAPDIRVIPGATTVFLIEEQQLRKGVPFTLLTPNRILQTEREVVTMEFGDLIQRLTLSLPQPLTFDDLNLFSVQYASRLEVRFSKDFPEVLQVELQPLQAPITSNGEELATVEMKAGKFNAETAIISDKANIRNLTIRYSRKDTPIQFARLQCDFASLPRTIKVLDARSEFRPKCGAE